uniref:Mitochondrial import receptor subunit TOM22 homolog n=1 Tax=Amblyomma variegatum TaxID=34610 RepID=F0JAE8_AMBVA|nr:TPA_inf: outer mitochondrial membrane complex subunit TOM22 translocase [Amblyomma variegatum]
MPVDEGDSGIDATSLPESRETSPRMSRRDLDVAAPSTSSTTEGGPSADDDLDLDETLSERLWGLTEMFPPSVRQGAHDLLHFSWGSVQGLYGFGRSALWVMFASSAILFAPVIFEMERLQMDEMSRQQQRQILLGPSAAVSGGAPPGMMPPMSPGQPPRR